VNGNHVSDFGLVLMVYMWYLAVNGNHVSDFGLVLMVYISNRKIVETEAKWIALTHITDHLTDHLTHITDHFPDLVQAFK
jgi:hypothetical protein